MRRLNVTHGDSRDEKKLKRFFPFEIKDHIIPSEYFQVKPLKLNVVHI